MSSEERVNLSPAEWQLMEYLWEHSPCTGREAADFFAGSNGWSRTTTLTLLRRALEKGAVRCDAGGGVRTYSPRIEREEAVTREAEDFLDRVCKGSVGLMMSAITKRQELSQREIDELYAILSAAKGAKP